MNLSISPSRTLGTPVTSPKKWYGKIVFALCCALITVLISLYGTAAEAVPFAILLMNILCPYIDLIGAKKNEEVKELFPFYEQSLF